MSSAYRIFLLAIVIFLKTICANGQQPTDTICLPVQTVTKIMAAADSASLLREMVRLLYSDIGSLSQININLRRTDTLQQRLISTYEAQVKTMQEQRGLYDAELSNIRTLLKKERRKRTWTAIGGLVGIAGAFYLGLKL